MVAFNVIHVYKSLFKEILLPQFDKFQTEIQGSLTKFSVFKVSGVNLQKLQNAITASGAENMECLTIRDRV